mmetsp:Transcript_31743/g.79749  ORF Transcript_31743/g.79749 Transcript_31743/m.79749 type:complete len:329 (-) Transcript_31743:1143-2129(-)
MEQRLVQRKAMQRRRVAALAWGRTRLGRRRCPSRPVPPHQWASPMRGRERVARHSPPPPPPSQSLLLLPLRRFPPPLLLPPPPPSPRQSLCCASNLATVCPWEPRDRRRQRLRQLRREERPPREDRRSAREAKNLSPAPQAKTCLPGKRNRQGMQLAQFRGEEGGKREVTRAMSAAGVAAAGRGVGVAVAVASVFAVVADVFACPHRRRYTLRLPPRDGRWRRERRVGAGGDDSSRTNPRRRLAYLRDASEGRRPWLQRQRRGAPQALPPALPLTLPPPTPPPPAPPVLAAPGSSRWSAPAPLLARRAQRPPPRPRRSGHPLRRRTVG